MGITRLLLLLAVGLLVWYAFNAWKRRREALARRAPRRVVMVRCERCGLHVPRNEAVLRDGRSYCCEAHGEAGARDRGS
ncbi:MAG: hypothetical protein GWN84_15795 [Gammaproteobacteria bacterium]|nr:hypothetical protein [Gammaproteobacteria bacterium]NIR84246.1 hypothetical protein [Gammaproteobacteria bacterium]NIR89716.1 hypothetical protein [Gammaproteobacteria bacterium]NIU05404.1 hypothetical protein [Gammaproteobacteria bacterium]NIV52350.1 hypothetical protein [Gammaproteobacteria bacterium]